ncbi:MAG TPA: MEDS domain-containing protein [Candidatus Paceibacterota bacterium]|nr:MEDS domain-containing protein [Candidatus Paceibacterota bacterium]
MHAIRPARLENALAMPAEYAQFGLVYSEPDLPSAVVAAFVRLGLESQDKIVFLMPEGTLASLRHPMSTRGIDLTRLQRSGHVQVLDPERIAAPSKAIQTDVFLQQSHELMHAIAASSPHHIRLVGDPTALLPGSNDTASQVALRSAMEGFLHDRSVAALWLIDRDRLNPLQTEAVIQACPWLIYEGSLCRNYFHLPSESSGSSKNPWRDIDKKLALLLEYEQERTRLAESNQELERANQLLLLEVRERKQMQAEQEAAQAKGIRSHFQLTLCSKCKRVRDEKNKWHPLEEFLKEYSESRLSHGLCPECSQDLFPNRPS